MWLGLFFQFFVIVHAYNDYNDYNDYADRLDKDDFVPSRINKCKTPLVPQGQCIPLKDCAFLRSLYKKEKGLISFILTGDRCGYKVGRLHACCPLTDEIAEPEERKVAITPEPIIGSNAISSFPTLEARRTTRDIDDEYRYTEKPFRLSTSTRRTFTRDDGEFGSSGENFNSFSTSTTRRTFTRDDGEFGSSGENFNPFSTSTTRRTFTRDDGDFGSSANENFNSFSTSTTRRSTDRDTEEEFGTTKRSNDNTNGNNNGIRHPNMRLLPQDECGPNSLSDKVIGGTTVDIGEYPWLTMLMYRSRAGITNRCGGALISSRYVLTAAHCIRSPDITRQGLKLQRARLGEWDVSSREDCQGVICNKDGPQEMDIEEVVLHPNYEPTSPGQPYDIALIRLSREIRFTDFIKPVCLPFGDTGNYTEKYVVAGWGKTSNRPNSNSNKPQQVALPMVDPQSCLKIYRERNGNQMEFIESQICAGGEKGKDSCQGDSGGPLMRRTLIKHQPRWQVIGIVSFGPAACGQESVPGVYTKVSSFLNWILDNVRS